MTDSYIQIFTQFKHSVNLINDYTGYIPDDNKLLLYGLYKQATCGNCLIPEPSRLYLKDYAKYSSWIKFKNMDKYDAMKQYTNLVKKIII